MFSSCIKYVRFIEYKYNIFILAPKQQWSNVKLNSKNTMLLCYFPTTMILLQTKACYLFLVESGFTSSSDRELDKEIHRPTRKQSYDRGGKYSF